MSGTTTPKAVGAANIFGSPGSTWAGGAAILSVVANAMQSGLPTNTAGWVSFAVSVLMGIGAIFSKA